MGLLYQRYNTKQNYLVHFSVNKSRWFQRRRFIYRYFGQNNYDLHNIERLTENTRLHGSCYIITTYLTYNVC